MIPRIDIGIACSSHQIPPWWATMWANLVKEMSRGTFELGQLFAVQSACPDFNKNQSVGGVFCDPTFGKRNNLTDANRDKITGYFLEGGENGSKADYIFWNDDDTIFPDQAITRLLRLEKPIAAGLYFNTNPPYNPIAYRKLDNGGYVPLIDYSPGAVLEVDSVGMGCTLIHRSVYEKIMDAYDVFMRPNASLIPIKKDEIHPTAQGPTMDQIVNGKRSAFVDGYYVMKLEKPKIDGQRQLFPFYALEYGRTEDMYFTELCESVGIRPWVDTGILCEHWKHQARTYEDFRKEYVRREIEGSAEGREVQKP